MNTELIRLSEEAESLASFIRRACKILGKSFRQASLEAGLSAGGLWNIASGVTERGDPDTIMAAARYFKVPEGNLLRLAGYPSQLPSTATLKEAQEIYDVLSEEERGAWIRHGRLLMAARGTEE